MEEKDFKNIIDYMCFEGFDYSDYKPFLSYFNEYVGDFDFTEEVALMLIKSQFNLCDLTFEDKEDHKKHLIRMIQEL